MRFQFNRKLRMTTVGMAVLLATTGTAVAGQGNAGQSYGGQTYGGQGYGGWTGGPMAGPSMMYPPVPPQPQYRYGPPQNSQGYGQQPMYGYGPYGQPSYQQYGQGNAQGGGSGRMQGGAEGSASMGTSGSGDGGASMSARGEMQGSAGGAMMGDSSAGAQTGGSAQGGGAVSVSAGMEVGASAQGKMAGSADEGRQRPAPMNAPLSRMQQPAERQPVPTQLRQGYAQAQAGQQNGGEEPIFGTKVEDLKGKQTVNKSGKEIGSLDRIVADRETGQLLGIVDVGGFLGIGGQTIALPLRGMSVDGDELVFNSDLSKEQIKRQRDYQAPYYVELKGDRIVGR